ncbi:short-chain dehydrogenase/reductase SDR [Cellulomonas flavigena DSM 20109]|uniref:Short-chain dehydrogenase/reductase SDR n=1 Tax=Cellulomonas flavigena (strain ATCC 482 / DSM 20109 / BCRC 11376 / JCM 18109 / NBRC 3775 / NCIMB 8073 / NRS 134) TaxID=446466 RepID=D5UJU7_CELFN|nr:SDR family NAD(P)-dependent oxidoreductase [Cellulomonas flavigena]ADG75735.1 short-chain dehydrogenase/reductase SDR [Cellulomonas flavigena DSM 20109]
MADGVLVTGATGGLGAATARALARRGHPLVLVVRDVARGEALAGELRTTWGALVDVRGADLADLASVRALAGALVRDDVPLRAVVCNAGVQVLDGVRRSPDGYELTAAANVLGHVALLAPLLTRLRPGARVVTLGSETHRGGRRAFGFPAARWVDAATLLDPPLDAPGDPGSGRVRYSTSKLACIALARELDAREGGVRAVAYDPGLMPETGLARDYPPVVRRVYAALTPLLVRLPGARRVRDSAEDLAWLATDPAAEPLMGGYVSGRRSHAPSPTALRADVGADVWSTCTAAMGSSRARA